MFNRSATRRNAVRVVQIAMCIALLLYTCIHLREIFDSGQFTVRWGAVTRENDPFYFWFHAIMISLGGILFGLGGPALLISNILASPSLDKPRIPTGRLNHQAKRTLRASPLIDTAHRRNRNNRDLS